MDGPIDLGQLKSLSTQITAHVDDLASQAENSDRRHDTRLQLLDSLTQTQQLLTSGTDFVTQLASQNNQFHCIRWLLHFNIPRLIPLPPEPSRSLDRNGKDVSGNASANPGDRPSITFAQVAEQARVPEKQVRRISRMAMLRAFLCEPSEGRVAHTPLSAAFARSVSLHAWGQFVTDISAPMVTKMVEATERWGRGGGEALPLPANATAYNIAWNTELPFFQHIDAEPELGIRYGEYLRHMTVNRGVALDHLVSAFPHSISTGPTTVVVDVGGGFGQASFALTTAYPHLRCLVQDRPEVIERAKGMVVAAAARSDTETQGVPGVQDSVAFEAHNFFKPQPLTLPPRLRERWQVPSSSSSHAVDMAGGAYDRDVDVFLLRQILHDWQDDKAAAILRNLVPRLRPTGRIVIMDTVLPEPVTSKGLERLQSRVEDAALRVRDLTMMQTYNAQERDITEWKAIFIKTGVGLRLDKVSTPRESHMSILEVVVDKGDATAS